MSSRIGHDRHRDQRRPEIHRPVVDPLALEARRGVVVRAQDVARSASRQASAHASRSACASASVAPAQPRDRLAPALAQHEQRQRAILERVLEPRDARQHPRRVHLVRLLHEALAPPLQPRHHPAALEADVQHRDQRVEAVLVAPERLHLVEELGPAGPGGRAVELRLGRMRRHRRGVEADARQQPEQPALAAPLLRRADREVRKDPERAVAPGPERPGGDPAAPSVGRAARRSAGRTRPARRACARSSPTRRR